MTRLEIADCINALLDSFEEEGVEYYLNSGDGLLSADGEGWRIDITYCEVFAEVLLDYWSTSGRDKVRQMLIRFEGLDVPFESVSVHEGGKEVFIRYMVGA